MTRTRRQAQAVAAAPDQPPGPVFVRAVRDLARGFVRHPESRLLRAELSGGGAPAAAIDRQIVRLACALACARIASIRGVIVQDATNAQRRSGGEGRWSAVQASFAALAETSGCPLWDMHQVPALRSAGISDDDLAHAAGLLDQWVADCAADAMDQLGSAFEQSLDLQPALVAPEAPSAAGPEPSSVRASARRVSGSYYTPRPLVEHLLDSALEPVIAETLASAPGATPTDALLRIKVCDPACGTGRFLLAAARRLALHVARARTDSQSPPSHALQSALIDVVQSCIFGVDLNATAADLCRAALWLECVPSCGPVAPLRTNIRVGDALHGAFDAITPDSAFDVIVGNPPFLNQLQTATAASRRSAAALRDRFDGAVRGYADLSAAFLLLATRITRPGGRVALVQPQSLLSVKDAAPVRRALLARASLEALWISNERVFRGASVFTCAPTLHVQGPRRLHVKRAGSARFTPFAPVHADMDELASAQTWAHLAAAAAGIPELSIRSGGTLADLAGATADFRDQYYGLDGFIVEDADLDETQRADASAFPPLVTTGLIDPAVSRWGQIPTRILKQSWLAPRIDRARMDLEGSLGPWLLTRLVPKILLATQTRTIEVFVDDRGTFVPATPLITITPHDHARSWHIAAALSSPVAAALAMQRFGGAALCPDAIKLSASQALRMPLPSPGPDWNAAAEEFRLAALAPDDDERDARLLSSAALSCSAFGVARDQFTTLMDWWLPRRTRRGALTRKALDRPLTVLP